jgi:hypothetical protein
MKIDTVESGGPGDSKKNMIGMNKAQKPPGLGMRRGFFLRSSFLYVLLVLQIFEVNLEVLQRLVWSWSVHLRKRSG